MYKNKLIDLVKKNKIEPRNKGITIKVSETNFNLIKSFCKENKCSMSEIFNVKIEEIIREIKKYNL